MNQRPLGIFDSGIGGLSVAREIQRLLPHENLLYLADHAHLPYGPRSLEEIRYFMEGVTRFFLAQNVKLIVIACNTASAGALRHLRQIFPDGVPFVGMEPAVRPAARDTRSGVIGVIATAATFQGELYASVVDRFAKDVRVATRACPELVALAERGAPWTRVDYDAVARLLSEMRAQQIDQLVLGCTHFPFLMPLLQAAVGDGVTIVDPAPAVARQALRMLEQQNSAAPTGQRGQMIYLTSGEPALFARQIENLLGIPAPPTAQVRWNGNGSLS